MKFIIVKYPMSKEQRESSLKIGIKRPRININKTKVIAGWDEVGTLPECFKNYMIYSEKKILEILKEADWYFNPFLKIGDKEE